MVPMTFYGMRMLASLWSAGRAVPPLEPRQAEKAVLLEGWLYAPVFLRPPGP